MSPLLAEAESVVTQNILSKRNHVAKEAVSSAWQTKTRQRSDGTQQTGRLSNGEAVALRKNHVVRQLKCQSGSQHFAVFLERDGHRFIGDE